MNKYYKKTFTIPNCLSLLRIILIPFIVWAFSQGRFYTSAILIICSAFTDIIDGYIARRFNMISEIGKALDPVADKLTLFTILFCLSLKNRLVLILLVVFVIKEVIMCVEGFLIVKYTGTTYSAKWYGKLSTFILYLTVILLVAFKEISLGLTLLMFYSCLVVVILSLILYTIYNAKKIMVAKK